MGTPDGEDSPLQWEAEDVFTIGTISGEEWETFARISGVAFDREGNLFLLDSDNFRVVKVDPDGALVAEMGGEGGGPGEFGMPMAISVTAEGEVRVYDLGNGGFVRFNPDGSYAGFVPMDPELGVFPYGGLLAHPGGGMLTSGSGGGRIRQGPGGGLEVPATRPVHLFSLGDEVEVRTVYEGWNPATAGSAASVSTEAGGRISFRLPALRAFDPPLLIGVLPDGRVAVADTSTYQVKIMDLQGTVESVVQRPFTPREVTQADQDAEKERQLEAMVASGGPRMVMRTDQGLTTAVGSEQAKAMLQGRIEAMEFGPEMPLLEGMGVDWDGKLWIERRGEGVGDDGPVDLFDSEGQYLGTVPPGELRIPDAFGPGGLVAFIETDDLDVPRLVVQRVSFH
jgi:hypothetical protein